eukprot:jgi/Ulvmu1/8056/UM004_0293.1
MLDDLENTPARRRTNGSEEDHGSVHFTPIHLGDQAPARKQPYRSSKNGRLLWWDEVPPQLQFNPYIASGYRANLPYRSCMCSLFALHNESCNVWLHFWPALALIAAVVYISLSSHPHKLAFCTVLVPQIVCLLLSTAYHLFMAQVKHYSAWLRIDICGVFGVMMVPYFITTWWGYHCQPFWGAAVLIMYYGCAFAGLLVAAFATSASARAAPMGMLVVVRFASLLHRWVLGTCSPAALWSYLQVEVLCTVGAFINVYRVPERWWHVKQSATKQHRVAQPLDLFGNSHNIMHALSLITMWNICYGVASESDHILHGPGCPA